MYWFVIQRGPLLMSEFRPGTVVKNCRRVLSFTQKGFFAGVDCRKAQNPFGSFQVPSLYRYYAMTISWFKNDANPA